MTPQRFIVGASRSTLRGNLDHENPCKEVGEMSATDLASLTSERIQAWNRHDSGAYAAFYRDDATVQDPLYPEPLTGKEAIREDFEGFLTTFPDTEFTLGNVVASDDTVAFEVVARGTHEGPLPGPAGPIPATGRTMEMLIAAFARIDDQGLIVEERRYFDTGGLLQQLGLT
jgi:steroid delta-isomerase-like uncharacterized protein